MQNKCSLSTNINNHNFIPFRINRRQLSMFFHGIAGISLIISAILGSFEGSWKYSYFTYIHIFCFKDYNTRMTGNNKTIWSTLKKNTSRVWLGSRFVDWSILRLQIVALTLLIFSHPNQIHVQWNMSKLNPE